jgi:hypothetical protein
LAALNYSGGMQQILENLSRFLSRFRYPVSLPEDIATDLGLDIPNTLTFEQFLNRFSAQLAPPKHLWKWMRRDAAENVFKLAQKSEIFLSSTLYSYYFSKGWIVIALYFDENEALRRVYVQCPQDERQGVFDGGFDLVLDERKAMIVTLHPLAKEI